MRRKISSSKAAVSKLEVKRQSWNKENTSVPQRLEVQRTIKYTKALREIKFYQRSVNLLIPRAPFLRVVRDILESLGVTDMRVSASAVRCLQESVEMYLVQLFEDSLLCCLHASRKTLMVRDVRLARRIGGRSGFYL